MYHEHFGLSRPPFKITPDTTLFYSGADRGSVLDALNYVVLSGEGITKVIGEVGSGKTMLCRMLEEKLPDDRVVTVYIANPSISPENILNVIAFEAGLVEEPASKLESMQLLQQWLLEKYTENKKTVILIEEAQGMPLATLEEIRLLSNLETDQDKLLQIVLFGQPELDENLSDNSIRQLRERITHNFYLSPLSGNQIRDYLNFRVRSAGYHGPDLFDDKITRLITQHSKGLIRRINILADKILLAAYADGTTQLTIEHANKAAKDSVFSKQSRWWAWPASLGWSGRPVWISGLVGLAFGLVLASLVWLLSPGSQQELAQASEQATGKSPEQSVSEPTLQQKKPESQAVEPSETGSAVSAAGTVGEAAVAAEPQAALAKESTIEPSPAAGINNAQASSKSSELSADSAIPASDSVDISKIDDENILTSAHTATLQPVRRDLLEIRLTATQDWLAVAQAQEYSIQLMTLSTTSSQNLNRYLNQLPKTIELSDIFVYETHTNGKQVLGVLYQVFESRAAAREKLRDMPEVFHQFEPFLLRTVQGLRKEIAANEASLL